MSQPINVAIIGSGGREHALAWRMSQSPTLGRLFALPGNPGIARIAQCANVQVSDHAAVARFCHEHEVGLVVVGPEDPLAAGITDDLTKAGLAVFGPKRAAARLEADKSYSKEVMRQASVPGVIRSCPPPATMSGHASRGSTSASVMRSTDPPISASWML